MSWSELIKREMEHSYKTAENLIDLVDEDSLDWKPSTGNNWMTMGQLLKHIAEACGVSVKGFVTGEWEMPDGTDTSEMSEDEMLPPAEKLPTVASIAEAKEQLEKDKQLAFEMLASCEEEALRTKIVTAPWDPTEMVLGHQILQMVDHLKQHKGQLFYYLKLQGKPVHTGNLWGM